MGSLCQLEKILAMLDFKSKPFVNIKDDLKPRLVFPVYKTPTGQLALCKIPVVGGVTGDLRCQEIQSAQQFHSWALNPWTGECNLTVDKELIKQAVLDWLGDMRPTQVFNEP